MSLLAALAILLTTPLAASGLLWTVLVIVAIIALVVFIVNRSRRGPRL